MYTAGGGKGGATKGEWRRGGGRERGVDLMASLCLRASVLSGRGDWLKGGMKGAGVRQQKALHV